jgi:Zn-dependent protease/CBS domain-containing protein
MGSFRFARVFGIDLKVHTTFLLALGLGAFQWGRFGFRGAAFGMLLVVLLFGCVVLHELGHSLVAKGFGIPVREIILLPIGGMAQMSKKPKTPAQELLIAVVGPMVNVAIAVGLVGVGGVWLGQQGMVDAVSNLAEAPPSVETMWVMLTASNVMLAVFNMLPALPMDGGRVLRSVLSMGLGQSRATAIAAVVARVLAVAMLLFALFSGQIMLGLIALFVFFGANAEAREERLTGALGDVTVAQAVNPRAVTFAPNTTLAEGIQWLVRNPQAAFAVLHEGRLVGVVIRRALIQAAQEQGPYAYVASVMERSVPTIAPSAQLIEARAQMNGAESPYVAVMDGDRFVGMITEQELAQQAAMADVFARFGPRTGGPGGTFARE